MPLLLIRQEIKYANSRCKEEEEEREAKCVAQQITIHIHEETSTTYPSLLEFVLRYLHSFRQVVVLRRCICDLTSRRCWLCVN